MRQPTLGENLFRIAWANQHEPVCFVMSQQGLHQRTRCAGVIESEREKERRRGGGEEEEEKGRD